MKYRNIHIIFFLFFLCSITLKAQKAFNIEYNQKNKSVQEINFQLNNHFFDTVKTSRGQAFIPRVEDEARILKKGAPDLPRFSRSLIIDNKKATKLKVISVKYVDYENILIAPSKGSIKRTDNPEDIPFTFGDEYNTAAFYPSTNAFCGKSYIFRDFRGQTLFFQPFQYHPVNKTLRIYTHIRVELISVNKKGTNTYPEKAKKTSINKEFDKLYKSHFINYNTALSTTRYTPLSEEGNLLIISHPDFLGTIEPFVKWKRQKGIQTEVITVEDYMPGQVKSLVENYYQAKDLTFLLLVGDAEHIPPFYKTGDSDAAYGHILGDDSYAEVIVGRFSGTTEAEIATQVQRTIEYEKFPELNASWYSKYTLIASDEGPGDEHEYDFEHMRNIKNKLLDYNYMGGDELYDGDQAEDDLPGNPTPEMLAEAINQGRGIIAYAGHGNIDVLGTTYFSNEHISLLNNTGKLPFVINVACLNGNFKGETCFAEAWLRATHDGQPAGAVAMVASTIEQEWNPPMAGQDEMVNILTGQYPDNMKYSFGGMVVNGCMKMIDKYSSFGEETANTWTIFGDPTLELRTKSPAQLLVNHKTVITKNSREIPISCNHTDAHLCLSRNDTILYTGKILSEKTNYPVPECKQGDTLLLTITAYNYVPFINEIPVVSRQEAAIAINNIEINDTLNGNKNNKMETEEEISLDFIINNSSALALEQITLTATTQSPYIQISDSVYQISTLDSEDSLLQKNKFKIAIKNSPIDQEIAAVQLLVKAQNGKQWQRDFYLQLHTPKIELKLNGLQEISGNFNQIPDPGELFRADFTLTNHGHALFSGSKANFIADSPHFIIKRLEQNLPDLAADNTLTFSFEFEIDSLTPRYHQSIFSVSCENTSYKDSLSFDVKAGVVIENWENNAISFMWENSGTKHWLVQESVSYAGDYALQSGPITHNQNSIIEIDLNITRKDSLSFYLKTSSEENFDYLKFYIDDELIDKWSGKSNWQHQKYMIDQGRHTLKWEYVKDAIVSEYQDCAWIDFIYLPYHNFVPVYETPPPVTLESGVKYYYKTNIYDNDNDSISIKVETLPEWLSASFTKDTLTISGTPLEGDKGAFPVEVSISDQKDKNLLQYTLYVGCEIENWESGDFSKFYWKNGGGKSWEISPTESYQGSFSAKSGDVTHNQKSRLILAVHVKQAGKIKFKYKVSSEKDYDFLNFYVDNKKIDQWSGQTNWLNYELMLDSGFHTLSWVYAKDDMLSDGEDCAWIDDILLPLHDNPAIVFTSYPPEQVSAGNNYTYNIKATDYEHNNFSFSSSGLPVWLELTSQNNGNALLAGRPSIIDTGRYEISVYAEDDNYSAIQTFTIEVLAKQSSFIPQIDDKEFLKIWPVPVKNKAYISFQTDQSLPVKIKVYDMQGSLKYSTKTETIAETPKTIRLNTQTYSPGVYFCCLYFNNEILQIKFIKTK